MNVKTLFKKLDVKKSIKDIDRVKWVVYKTASSNSNYFWQPNLFISNECLNCDFISDIYNTNIKWNKWNQHHHVTVGLYIKRIIESDEAWK